MAKGTFIGNIKLLLKDVISMRDTRLKCRG